MMKYVSIYLISLILLLFSTAILSAQELDDILLGFDTEAVEQENKDRY